MHFLIFPLISAFFYSIATLFLKRALEGGCGTWRTTFVCNVTLGTLSQLGFFWAGPMQTEAHGFQPILAGVFFFSGQIFTFLALQRGDVSVATPILGTKAIFVAFFTVLVLGQSIPLLWWLAAVLGSVALIFLGPPLSEVQRHRHFLRTAILACLSAGSFAAADICIQKFSPYWTFAAFAPRMFGFGALLSLTLLPFFEVKRPAVGATLWFTLGLGAFILSCQALNLCYALGTFGQATAINIVYNSRGIWTVLLVWIVGHWFANRESEAGHDVMGRRLVGALLLLSAVVLVLSVR